MGEWGHRLLRLVVLALLLLGWHVAVTVYGVGDGFVPSPAEVATALHDWIFGAGTEGNARYSGTWSSAAVASATRVFAGFAAAAVAGIIAGTLIGRFRLVADLLDPSVQLLRPIPVSAWVPFSLVFFGIKPIAAIFLVTIGAFFPVVLNTANGARHVSLLHLRSAEMLGAGRLRVLLAVILPASLPSIMVGLRVAMGLAWVLVIVAEMVAVKSGLGYELWNAYYYSRMDIIVADMLSIGVFGFISDWLIVTLSARLLSWHEATDR